ncbi:MAG: hypothetical protein K2O05_01600 [Anaeroplasmataceae bacterium]|nr:hypothetical protein [Anaeroplasmataceae bacterium]
MNKKILISFIVSFTILFCGVIFVILAALNDQIILMYIGLSLIIIGSILFASLILFVLRKWLMKEANK